MANNKPIFTGIPVVTTVRLTTSFTNYTTSDMTELFVSDPTYGSYVKKIRAKFVGGNAMTSSPTTDNVLKIGLSGSSGVELFDEIYLPKISLATSAGPNFELPMNIPLGLGDKIYVGLTKSPTGSTVDVTLIGGNFTKN